MSDITTMLERAKQIYEDINEDDPKKIKAWKYVCKAYEQRGFKVHVNSTFDLVRRGKNYGALNWINGRWSIPGCALLEADHVHWECAPLWESHDAMHEFEQWLFEQNDDRLPMSAWKSEQYVEIVSELLGYNDDFSLMTAPAAVRFAAFCAVLEK